MKHKINIELDSQTKEKLNLIARKKHASRLKPYIELLCELEVQRHE